MTFTPIPDILSRTTTIFSTVSSPVIMATAGPETCTTTNDDDEEERPDAVVAGDKKTFDGYSFVVFTVSNFCVLKLPNELSAV